MWIEGILGVVIDAGEGGGAAVRSNATGAIAARLQSACLIFITTSVCFGCTPTESAGSGGGGGGSG